LYENDEIDPRLAVLLRQRGHEATAFVVAHAAPGAASENR
jgi:hypothetical protein